MNRTTPEDSSQPTEKEEERGWVERYGLATAIIVVVGILGGWTWALHKWGDHWIGDTGWSGRGQIGDSFGAVNALFSGLAFACLIIALSLQRKDLDITRRELKKSAKAQALTANTQGKIALLNAYQTLRNSYSDKLAFLEKGSNLRIESGVDHRKREAEIVEYRKRCLEFEERLEEILAEVEAMNAEAATADGGGS